MLAWLKVRDEAILEYNLVVLRVVNGQYTWVIDPLIVEKTGTNLDSLKDSLAYVSQIKNGGWLQNLNPGEFHIIREKKSISKMKEELRNKIGIHERSRSSDKETRDRKRVNRGNVEKLATPASVRVTKTVVYKLYFERGDVSE